MIKSTILLLTLLISSMAFSQTWVINRDHSEILFQVPYMGVSELTGRFNEFTGEMTGEKVEIKISSSSIDTGNKMRDGHLKGSDFFQSKEHPYIVFTSKSVKQVKGNSYQAKGDLTIKGITKDAVIDFTMTESLKDTWGYENKFVKFKSTLNRKDYKINWNKTLDGQQFLVGDVITFWGTFQIQPAKKATPNSKHMIPDTEYIRERDLERNESSFSRKLRNLINGK